MLGSAYLAFIEDLPLRSKASTRFMDDLNLFSNSVSSLREDFYVIQRRLGERGLALNEAKTAFRDHKFSPSAGLKLDTLKTDLLQIRRQRLEGSGLEMEMDDGSSSSELSEAQREYLLSLLQDPKLEEHDAELVLTVLDEDYDEVLECLPDLISRFPHLAPRVHRFCGRLNERREDMAEVLLDYIETGRATEFQLFWAACMVDDYLRETESAEDLVRELLGASNSTEISRARVLEIDHKGLGLPELRSNTLRSSGEVWEAWASARGAVRAGENVPKAFLESELNQTFIKCLRASATR